MLCPLSIRINGTWYTYGWDLTKNICELYSTGGGIATTYTYTPFGKVTSSGNITQLIQWSSEYNDTELGLVYYNYRYYSYSYGRWIIRDSMGIQDGNNIYSHLQNQEPYSIDYLGASTILDDYLWIGGKCFNNSKNTEYVLIDGVWVTLLPGDNTPWNKDCDGMTCCGKFYAVRGVKIGRNDAICSEKGMNKEDTLSEWDGNDNSAKNSNSPRGRGAKELPPNIN